MPGTAMSPPMEVTAIRCPRRRRRLGDPEFRPQIPLPNPDKVNCDEVPFASTYETVGLPASAGGKNPAGKAGGGELAMVLCSPHACAPPTADQGLDALLRTGFTVRRQGCHHSLPGASTGRRCSETRRYVERHPPVP